MFASDWITATIDIDRSTEFTGDDADRYTDVIDLEDNYEFLTVFIPTITSASITPYLQMDGDIDTVPVASYFFHDNDADTDVIQSSAAATTTKFLTFNIGGCRYLRLYSSANQAADRTLYCRGYNRVSYGP